MPTLAPAAAPTTPADRNLRLWQLAKCRVKFQGHLVVYLLVNAGLWALYLLTNEGLGHHRLPWPAYTSLFWGLGLLNHYLQAYAGLDQGERTQREYERLRRQA